MTHTTNELTPTDAITKIRALKEYTRTTGFKTTRSVNEILASLNATALAEVCAALNADQK
ncbi:MAG: hypothetical protein WBQ43_20495 [Terriglobales bacterium]